MKQDQNLISLTIPNDRACIEAAAGFFQTLAGAGALGKPEAPAAEVKQDEAPAAEVKQTEAPAAEIKQTEAPAAEVKQTEAPAAEVKQTEAPAAEVKPEDYPIVKNGIRIDFDGVPWDARIHSSSQKCRKSDGRWSPKRGGDKQEWFEVTKELRALQANAANAGAGASNVEPENAPYDASRAFTPKQSAPAGEPKVTDLHEFFTCVTEHSDEAIEKVCSDQGWANIGVAAAVVPSNPAIFDQVLSALALAER